MTMKKYLLVTDLDNTLVGDEDSTVKINNFLEAKREQFYLVYATGRSYSSANKLKSEAELLEPDYWVTSVGSEIYHQNIMDVSWANHLSKGWNRGQICAIVEHFSELISQPDCEQNPWKVSFWLNKTADFSIIDNLKNELKKEKLSAQVIFSSGRDVDILPVNANKGNATNYLQKQLKITPENTLVCGDSGNDIHLFEQNVKGVIVNNAQPELLKWYYNNGNANHYLAKSICADGILEAIHYFKMG